MTATTADILPAPPITIAPITNAERAGAIAALTPLLETYGGDSDRVPRSDLLRSSSILLRAHAHATQPDQLARWRSLPAAEFDLACLDALRLLAVGGREARAAVSSYHAQASEARVPVALVNEAAAHKRRVLRYVDYQLGDDPSFARELADIRSGTGYLDLESDLRRLAVLVKSQPATLAQDRFYAPDDAPTCLRLADAIASELATVAPAPSDWLNRLHAAIYRCYHLEVLPTASWLYRKTRATLAFYPSVYGPLPKSRSAPTPAGGAPP